MAFPQDGFIKIWPNQVSIISGRFSLNSDPTPQVVRSVTDLQAFYDTRSEDLVVAPCLTRDLEYPGGSGQYVPFTGVYELQFSPSSRNITFHNNSFPSPAVATLDLLSSEFPLGMEVTNLRVFWNGQCLFGQGKDREITEIGFRFGGGTLGSYIPGLTGLLTGNVGSPSNGVGAIIPQAPITTWGFNKVMTLFNVYVPVNSVISGSANIPRNVLADCFLLGTYNTQRFVLTNSTPLAVPGEIVDIIDSMDRVGIFDEYKIYWDTNEELDEEDINPLFPGITGGVVIPERYFFIHENGRIRFQIPKNLGIPYGGRRLLLYGVSDATIGFIGEVQLAQLNILLTDGSGVYHLESGQRHDTYYDRSTTPPTEVDLKMPRPNFRTGFF